MSFMEKRNQALIEKYKELRDVRTKLGHRKYTNNYCIEEAGEKVFLGFSRARSIIYSAGKK